VTPVRVAAQAARANRSIALLGRAREQMKQGEPDGALQLRIPVDRHVGVLPPRRPSPAVLA
jgi:hypothetical protein